ncbi:MAG: DUF4199 domain-containing protein [Bacteroidales bacterium]|jgi:hypothetical protein|nr:DUF4199 domain-containing protein [Bacteroidales bacterium]
MKKKTVLVLKWGGLLGIGMAFLLFLTRLPVFDVLTVGPIIDVMKFAIIFIAIYFGIKEYQDDLSEGKITFSKAFLIGALISVLAFLIVICYLMFHYAVIEKDALHKMDAFSVLLYSLLFTLFISLYLYRIKEDELPPVVEEEQENGDFVEEEQVEENQQDIEN